MGSLLFLNIKALNLSSVYKLGYLVEELAQLDLITDYK